MEDWKNDYLDVLSKSKRARYAALASEFSAALAKIGLNDVDIVEEDSALVVYLDENWRIVHDNQYWVRLQRRRWFGWKSALKLIDSAVDLGAAIKELGG